MSEQTPDETNDLAINEDVEENVNSGVTSKEEGNGEREGERGGEGDGDRKEGGGDENEEEDDEDADDADFEVEDELPPEVKIRVDYLRTLELERSKLEDAYVKEKIILEAKYKALYEPLFVKRSNIVNGVVDVRKVESPPLSSSTETTEVVDETTIEMYEEFSAPELGENGEGQIGVPNFWISAMVQNETVSSSISEEDVAALEYLTDIKCIDNEEMTGFTFEFHFKSNPYFTNEILTKSYQVPNLARDVEPYLEKSIGCTINWKAGKNLTEEEKKLRNRNKKGKGGQVKIKIVKKESFFNFFETLPFPSDDDLDEEEYDDEDDLLERHKYDFMIANVIRTKLIPKALSYFTGEEVDDEFYDFEGEDEDEDDDDDEDEDDEDDDEEDDDDDAPPPSRKTKNSKKTANMVKAGDISGVGKQGANNEECKQS